MMPRQSRPRCRSGKRVHRRAASTQAPTRLRLRGAGPSLDGHAITRIQAINVRLKPSPIGIEIPVSPQLRIRHRNECGRGPCDGGREPRHLVPMLLEERIFVRVGRLPIQIQEGRRPIWKRIRDPESVLHKLRRVQPAILSRVYRQKLHLSKPWGRTSGISDFSIIGRCEASDMRRHWLQTFGFDGDDSG